MKLMSILFMATAVLLTAHTLRADWRSARSTKDGQRTVSGQRTGEPSAWAKLTDGTRSFFANLFGAKKSTQATSKRLVHPYASSYTRNRNETKKDSPLTSWLKPKEPPPPKSTNEWMGLPPIRP